MSHEDDNPINVEALQQMVLLLRSLDPKTQQFDLSSWADTNSPGHACGTTACACGWAGVSPWFVKRGFSLMSVGRGTTVLITNPAQLHTALAQRFIIEPAYQGLVWMAAVSAFFQLDYCTADWLFSPCEYKLDRSPEAEDVAVRIEAVIAGYRPQLTT